MSIVYGGDKALDARLEKALGDTRLSRTLQASRRHLLEFRGAVEVRHPDWASASTARAPSAPTPSRARPELLDRFEAGDHEPRRPRDPRRDAGRRGARGARDRAPPRREGRSPRASR